MPEGAPVYEVEITTNAKAVVAQLQALPHAMTVGVARRLDLENQQTIRELILQKMNFPSNAPPVQDGLRRITSTAVRSLRASPAEVTGELAISTSVGSNLKYVRAQNEGFTGVQNVKPYSRRTFKYGAAKPKRYLQSQFNFGSGAMGPFAVEEKTKNFRARRVVKDLASGGDRLTMVRGHQRYMHLPARQFFQAILSVRIPAYGLAISDEIINRWNYAAEHSGKFETIRNDT